MSDYSKGKIYTLFDVETDEIFYVGSTTESLRSRKNHHDHVLKYEKGNMKVYDYIRKNKIEFDIQLHHNFPCMSKKELNREEGKLVKEFLEKGYNLQNQVIPGRTMREYYYDRHEYVLELARVNREINKELNASEVSCECGSTYRFDNRSHHQKTDQHRRWAGLEPITFKCECGAEVNNDARLSHLRSKKHLQFIGKGDKFKAIETTKIKCECGVFVTVPKSHKNPQQCAKMKRHYQSKTHKDYVKDKTPLLKLTFKKRK